MHAPASSHHLPTITQQMISAEAPVLFAKACEMFIHELTLRAWIHTDENKRRTLQVRLSRGLSFSHSFFPFLIDSPSLQRNDIATAIARNDTFDFLIDIVPRCVILCDYLTVHWSCMKLTRLMYPGMTSRARGHLKNRYPTLAFFRAIMVFLTILFRMKPAVRW